MPALTPELLEQIKAKFGSSVKIETDVNTLSEIISDIIKEEDQQRVPHDRTYNRGYQKGDYDRTYQQYDKTT